MSLSQQGLDSPRVSLHLIPLFFCILCNESKVCWTEGKGIFSTPKLWSRKLRGNIFCESCDDNLAMFDYIIILCGNTGVWTKVNNRKNMGEGIVEREGLKASERKFSWMKRLAQRKQCKEYVVILVVELWMLCVKFHNNDKRLSLSLLSLKLLLHTPGHLAKLFLFRVKVFFNTWLDI